MVGGLVRRSEGVRRFGKMFEKVIQCLEDVRDGERSCEKVGGGEKVWEDVRKGDTVFGGC
jgi:hypothetical protein